MTILARFIEQIASRHSKRSSELCRIFAGEKIQKEAKGAGF
jgi:hypothetical protein